MQIQRLISVFDRKDETLIKEIDLDMTALNLDKLKQIFKPSVEDPSMSLVYTIGEEEAKELKNLLKLEFDFKKYIYTLDCFSV